MIKIPRGLKNTKVVPYIHTMQTIMNQLNDDYFPEDRESYKASPFEGNYLKFLNEYFELISQPFEPFYLHHYFTIKEINGIKVAEPETLECRGEGSDQLSGVYRNFVEIAYPEKNDSIIYIEPRPKFLNSFIDALLDKNVELWWKGD